MTTTVSPRPESAPGPAAYRWRWVGLFVILAVEVMDLVDALVTNVAAPSIRDDLGGSDTLLQWLGAGYVLAMAVGLVIGGRLGDIYGRRQMFVLGATGFTLASGLCAAAVSPGMLVGSRVLQGLFGAVMLPQGLGMIKQMFPPKEVAAAFGAFGPVMGLSAIGGPVLAGWLVDADYWGTGWRMIFLINLPLGVLAVAGALRFLPATHGSGGSTARATRLDYGGAVLASAFGFLLVFPLVQGRELGWPAWIFACLAASVPMFALFAWYEARVQRRGGDPLVVPTLFRKRAFTAGLVDGLAFFSALIGFSLIFTLYVQLGLGYSPLRAGLASVPQSLGMVVAFIAASAGLSERFGRTLLQIGSVLMGLGVVGVLVTINQAGADVTPWQLSPALFVTGLGTGLVFAPFFAIVLAGVEDHETGTASGTLTAVQQLGGALGIALLGTLFFHLLGDGAAPGGGGSTAFQSAMERTLWAELGLLVAAFAATFLLPLRARPEDPANPVH